MKSFDIDFVRRPLPRWATAGFVVASAILFIASLNHFNDRRDQARSLAAERRKAIEDSMRPQPPSAATLRSEEQQAQERAALVYPWKAVFDAVEAAAGPDVKIVSFSHDRAGRRSHAVLEGSSFTAIDAALTRMKRSSPPTTEWTVESLSREQAEGTGSYRATVLGRW